MIDVSVWQQEKGTVPAPGEYRRWQYRWALDPLQRVSEFTGTFRQLEAAALGRAWVVLPGE